MQNTPMKVKQKHEQKKTDKVKEYKQHDKVHNVQLSIKLTGGTFGQCAPHFHNSNDCLIKCPTRGKSSNVSFSKLVAVLI